jgi:hypothetical protein
VHSTDFNKFIKNLDDALKHVYKPKAEFLICGNIHTDYLNESNWNKKKKLDSLLTTYNLVHTVNFATRIQSNSRTDIDNIFMDNSNINLYSVFPIINGLSDHDAQIETNIWDNVKS